VVVAVGPGKWNEDGDARIPCSVRTGDRVVFPQIKAEKILVEGIEYYVIEESRILAVITK
jgi:chaperonin GroES